MSERKKINNKPYIPVDYSEKEVAFIQALYRGDATPDQQINALKWIINVVSGAYDLPYYENDRDTAFACGRQFVGKQLIKMVNLIPSKVFGNKNGEQS